MHLKGSNVFIITRSPLIINNHNIHLKIAKEVGDRHGEGGAYGNLGNAYFSLGDLKKAIEYYNLNLKIAKEVGDKHGEGVAYGNLGNAHGRLGDLKKAIEYHNLNLKIAKEVGDKHGEGVAYGNLGNAHLSCSEVWEPSTRMLKWTIIYQYDQKHNIFCFFHICNP